MLTTPRGQSTREEQALPRGADSIDSFAFGCCEVVSMARFWEDPYSLEQALELGIHDFEGAPVVGVPNNEWLGNPDFRGWPESIYYVEVCNFTFAFFSLEMIREYLGFYSRKVLPTSRVYGVSPFSHGATASVGDGQTRFEWLPLRLRQESKRVRVVKALERALQVFGVEE